MRLPDAIYSTRQIRDLEAHAVRELGIAAYALMKRAGEGALRAMRTRWPTARRIAVVCGGGNNGGDGYVVARFAKAAGLDVVAFAAVAPQLLRGDAARACAEFSDGDGVIREFEAGALSDFDVVVDALLGIGSEGPVRDAAAGVIRAICAAARPVFALDLPSGLSGDTGLPLGCAVRADCTLTFVGLKTGLFLGDGPEYCGSLVFDDLGVTPPSREVVAPRLTRILEAELPAALPRRPRASHKGLFGRVLVVGGGAGMPGAARLAGEAALRVGAGVVKVAVAPQSVVAVAAGRPELIVHAIEHVAELAPLLAWADVVAIGPGLGRDAWAQAVAEVCFDAERPIIVDADALTLLADIARKARADWVLTPHPGEAARLIDCAPSDIQADRLAALEQLVARYGGICVLKGAGTLIGGPGRVPSICERGNPGMAAPGMGDVLTGAIAGIHAQIGDPWVAARVGVLAHAMAGDAEGRNGERGVLASEVARELRTWVNFQ